jgi:hypothetical protein
MSDDLPDVFHFWRHTWVRRGEVWEGPPVSDPAECLPLALACGRIEVRRGRYVIVDPWLTMARPGGVAEAELAAEAEWRAHQRLSHLQRRILAWLLAEERRTQGTMAASHQDLTRALAHDRGNLSTSLKGLEAKG